MTVFRFVCFTLFVLLNYEMTSGQLVRDEDILLNWCLDSQSHKHKPGKEDSLHGECLPWKDHACCTGETTVDLHTINMYNFSLDHCYNQTMQKMSDRCKKYFFRNNCFYECEPHIGLWVVETTRKIAKQRFHKVPLCASDCDEWWEACKEDFTCAYNWPRDFRFKNGHNYCRGECFSFEQVYQNASNFCENVWDESFVYTPDEKACMRLWFNSSLGNPNRQTAQYYIRKVLGGGATSIFSYNLSIFIVALINILIVT